MNTRDFTKAEVLLHIKAGNIVPISSIHNNHMPEVRETFAIKIAEQYWKLSFSRYGGETWQEGLVSYIIFTATEVSPQQKTIIEWVDV